MALLYSGMDDPKRFRRMDGDVRVVMLDGFENGIPFSLGDLNSIIMQGSESDGGYGTFGSVFADMSYGAPPVAGIKVFKPAQEAAGHDAAMKACEEEYSILRDIDGKDGCAPKAYMIGVYDMSSSSRPRDEGIEFPAIMMEHLRPEDQLSKQVMSGMLFGGYEGAKPTAEKTIEAGLAIARAISTCHKVPRKDGGIGVCHRDLTPLNVFVETDDDGNVRRAVLIDFGQSTRMKTRVSTRGRPAAVAFAAPEMSQESTSISCPSGEILYSMRNAPTVDIWSFGALLFFIRTGKVPLINRLNDSRYGGELAVKSRFPIGILDVVESSSSLDGALDDLIRKCTEFFPENRYGSFDEVIAELERMIRIARPQDPAVSVPEKTPPLNVASTTPPLEKTPKHAVPDDMSGEDEAGQFESIPIRTPPLGRFNRKKSDRTDAAARRAVALEAFAVEFDMSTSSVRDMLEKSGYSVDEYAEFLKELKWMMMASNISKSFGVDEATVKALLPLHDEIPIGDYEKVLNEKKAAISKLLGKKAEGKRKKKKKQTFTVTYSDGAGGEVFQNMEYTVDAGSKTPVFTPNRLEREGYKPGGWSKEIADKVEDNITYTMTWVKDKAKVTGADVAGIVKDNLIEFAACGVGLAAMVLLVVNVAMGGAVIA